MRLIEAYSSGWSRSFDYTGCSNRGDYWWFVLGNLIVAVVAAIVSDKLYTLYALASIAPGMPLAVRRLRDSGKAWPWLLIGLIPIIGGIWLIVLFCQPSLQG